MKVALTTGTNTAQRIDPDIIKLVGPECPEDFDCCVLVSCLVIRDEGDTADGYFLKTILSHVTEYVVGVKFDGTAIVASGPNGEAVFDTEETSGSYSVALVFGRMSCEGDDVLVPLSGIYSAVTVMLQVDGVVVGSWSEQEHDIITIEAGNWNATTGVTARSIREVRASSSLTCLRDPDLTAECPIDNAPNTGEAGLTRRLANVWDSVSGGGTFTDGELRLDGSDTEGGAKAADFFLGCCFFKATLTVVVTGSDTRSGCGTTFSGTKTVCTRHNYCNGIAQGPVVQAWWSSDFVPPYQVDDLNDMVHCADPDEDTTGYLNVSVNAFDHNNAPSLSVDAGIILATSFSLQACSDCGLGIVSVGDEQMLFEIQSPQEQEGVYDHTFEISGTGYSITIDAHCVIERETLPC